MNKINLFILGMQRAGSTSLFNFLSTHDKISFTLVKETNIFSDKRFFKLMRFKNFIPYFIILFLKKYLYQEPNSHNLDNFYIKKLNFFFSDDQNYLNNSKFL